MAKYKPGFYIKGMVVAIVGNPFNIRKLYPPGWYIWAHSIPVQGPFKTPTIARACMANMHHTARKYCKVVNIYHPKGKTGNLQKTQQYRKVAPNKKYSVGLRRYRWLNWYRAMAHPYGLSHKPKFGHWGYTYWHNLY